MVKIKDILRIIPNRVRSSIYHRLIHPPSESWDEFFSSAPLHYAQGIEVDLKPGDRMHGQIAFAGYHEKSLSERIVQIGRKRGGLFVDVGANVGYFSLLWISANPQENHALAVEPSPRVLPLLKKNIQSNHLDRKIDVLEGAAGEKREEIRFDQGPEEETGWGGPADAASDATTIVDQYRLDTVIDQEVTLMKIDAEGADTLALRGCEDLLEANRIHRTCFEHNVTRATRLGIEEDAPFTLLNRYGYNVEHRNSMWWAAPCQ